MCDLNPADFGFDLNNREIAALIWIATLATGFLLWRQTRSSALGVIRAFFAWPLVRIFLAMTIYTVAMVTLFAGLNLWEWSNLKTTLLWWLTVGFASIMDAQRLAGEPGAFHVHHKRRRGKPLDGFSHALLWLQQLWLKQKEGKGLSLDQLIQASAQPFEIDSDHMISMLQKLNLIHIGADGRYLLSRDLNDISLYWLSKRLPYNLPDANDFEGMTMSVPWENLFKENDKLLQSSLAVNLATLFASEHSTNANKNIVAINHSDDF